MELGYLFWAYNIIWISLAVYVWTIASRQSAVRKEIESLRDELEERRKNLLSKQ